MNHSVYHNAIDRLTTTMVGLPHRVISGSGPRTLDRICTGTIAYIFWVQYPHQPPSIKTLRHRPPHKSITLRIRSEVRDYQGKHDLGQPTSMYGFGDLPNRVISRSGPRTLDRICTGTIPPIFWSSISTSTPFYQNT